MKYLRNDKGLKRLGNKIRLIRRKEGISQSQLGYEANISKNQVSRIENGEINTGISTILAIADALNVHPKELFDF